MTLRPTMRSMAGLVVACVLGTACRPAAGSHETIQPVYDEGTGQLELLKYDANHDGVIETFSYMKGNRILRIEIDADGDGRIDRWEYYGASQRLERVGFSRGHDGREDAWSYADAAGAIVRIEMSTNRDGRVTRTEHFDREALVRAEEDTDADGVVDKWEAYDRGRLTRVVIRHRACRDTDKDPGLCGRWNGPCRVTP